MFKESVPANGAKETTKMRLLTEKGWGYWWEEVPDSSGYSR